MKRILKFIFLLLISITVGISNAQTLTKAEYFVDTDPGVGKATAITVSSPADSLILTPSIPTTGLALGFHTLFVRFMDSLGVWGLTEDRTFFIAAPSITAPLLANAEYFIDTDPGVGKGTAIAVASSADSLTLNPSISTTGLAAGFHTLYTRFKDANGIWGLSEGRTFFITTPIVSAPLLSNAEYFFDTDPGVGKGTAIAVASSADSLILNPSIPTTGLAAGFHTLYTRFRDASGIWGLSEGRTFYINTQIVSAPPLTNAEYFFDTDPGVGKGTAIAVASSADSLLLNPSISTTGLAAGFHIIYTRFKDASGIWGLTEGRMFYINATSISAPPLTNAEYFFDTDPGVGNAIAIAVASSADSLLLNPGISTTGLAAGFHIIYTRFKDASGIWGLTEGRVFYINNQSGNSPILTNAEYFFDTDPGNGKATALTVSQGDSITLNNILIPVTGLSIGSHNLFTRFRDLNGVWGLSEGRAITICVAPVPPTAQMPITTICIGTSASLSVTDTSAGTFGWYSAATGGVYLGGGSTYQTPILNIDTTYYVQDSNSCLPSTRTAVKVKVIGPAITANASANTVCSGTAVTLTGSGTAVSYSWSNNVTDGVSFVPASTHTYTVTGTDANSCTNTATTTIIVNTTPNVTANATLNTVCQGTAVTLTGGGASSYTWTGSVTNGQSFVPASTQTYTVTGTTNNCSATDTTTVIVNSFPTVTANASAKTVCTGAEVTLTGSGTATSYTWTGGVTNGVSFVPAGTKTYTVTGTLNNCSKTDVTTVTISPTLAPTVTANASAHTICPGSQVTLTASGTATSYSWSSGVSNGVSFAPSATQTYIVTGTTVNGCSNTATTTVMVDTLNVGITLSTDTATAKATATATVVGGISPFSYSWNSSAQTTMIATNLSVGSSYTVTVKDKMGCSTKSSAFIPCSNIDIFFRANPTSNPAPLNTDFTNTTSNFALYNFTWFWGDGTSTASNNANVPHIYQNAGVYNVALVATSGTGCTDTLVKPSYIYASGPICSQTATISHSGTLNPGTIKACYGDTVVLSSNTDPSFSYDWNINSTLIGGASDSTFGATQSGYYSVTVIKNGCPNTSNAVQIIFDAPIQQPSISSVGSIISCTGGTITLTANSSTNGLSYLWNTGQTTSSISVNTSGSYSVTVKDVSGCTSPSIPYAVNASTAPAQDICLVTVDSLTSTYNIITWEKPITTAIKSFKVYREITTNNYSAIATILYDSLSEYHDLAANPNVTQYRYRMSSIDTCGFESDFSNSHLTIHLQVTGNGNLSWNLYQIENTANPVNFYIVQRDDNHTGTFHDISTTVPGGNTSYTDINYASYPNAAYRVSTQWNISCTATRASAVTTSFSNEGSLKKLTGIETYNLPNIIVYPNPSSGIINLNMGQLETAQVYVYDVLGESIYQHTITSSIFQIDLSAQPDGVYILKINTQQGIVTKKVVVSH